MSDNSIDSQNTTAGIRVTPASGFTPLEVCHPRCLSRYQQRLLTGFTFIEVLIALTVVSISLLALLRFCLLSIKMADKAQITSQAVFLAEEKISQTLAAGYPKEGTDSGTFQNNGVLFDWQLEVAEAYLPGLGESHVEGLRKISVDVSWKQSIGRNHLQMSTYVADKTYNEP